MNRVAVLDLETDPFEYGKLVQPFVAGFYDGDRFISIWGKNCVERIISILANESEPFTIYAHNGGRFDWFYFLTHINKQALRIVNGRIIQAYLGKHELRDSYAIMPFPLESYKKTPIDYATFKEDVRETHRETIVSYLRDDCVDLFTLVSAFVTEFGNKLTIGGTAMSEIKKFHSFRTGTKEYDVQFRTNFYFGGRNQVFKAGIIKAPIKVYDVNSMYPFVMRDYLHPISTGIYRDTKIVPGTSFVSVEGRNHGAFPTRMKDGSLDFTVPRGTFHTTIHEFEASQETETFQVDKIVATYGFSERIHFDEFVTHFYDARSKAKAEGDKIKTLFYKFVMNSGYGKFAQNPENYADWFICAMGELPPEYHLCVKGCESTCRKKWTPAFIHADYIIWERPLKSLFYFNIATGASITGAARAVLLRGLSHAKNPYYCDTDSIICEELSGVTLSESELGAWKLEAEGDRAAICGKKLYAIFMGNECVKKAHKGARLTAAEILHVAKGGEVEACNPVPSFKWDGSHSFTKRTIRATHAK